MPSPAAQPPPDLARTYDKRFYDELDADVRSSAEVVVPMVVELLHPRSVLDVGCGRGTWLGIFVRNGITDVVGVDGPHFSPSELEIPATAFVEHDFNEPFSLGRTFDLAVSLEVAEHLPEAVAPAFVASLVAHAPAVLFSAAIPQQGGAGHVNEQWPSYWRAKFAAHGYAPVDAIRPRVWTDDRVAYWYAQNTMLYLDSSSDTAQRLLPAGTEAILDLVHPAMYLRRRAPARKQPPSLSRLLRELPSATGRAIRRRSPGGSAR